MSTEKINIAYNYAMAQVGKPYVNTPPGARPPNSWDCSKLTASAWGQAGISLTPYSAAQINEVRTVSTTPSTNGLQKGDLLFYYNPSWGRVGHVSMYRGDGTVVEASSPSTGVRTHPVYWSNFVKSGRPHGIGNYDGSPGGGGEPGAPGGGGGGGGENDKDQLPVNATREVKKNAVAVSLIVGTPHKGRFAIMNTTNESVYLTQDTAEAVTTTEFSLSGKAIIAGDFREVKREVPGGNRSFELTIDSSFVQNESQATAIADMITRSLAYEVEQVSVEVFGNPLIQLGDTVKFNFSTRKIVSSENSYYIVTSVRHSYSSSGLSTSLVLKPLIQSITVV